MDQLNPLITGKAEDLDLLTDQEFTSCWNLLQDRLERLQEKVNKDTATKQEQDERSNLLGRTIALMRCAHGKTQDTVTPIAPDLLSVFFPSQDIE